MLAVLYFLGFEGCGAAIVRFLLPQKNPVTRVWLGLALGLALMMWLPALCAFAFAFSLAAHWSAAALMALLTAAAWLIRDRSPVRGMGKDGRRLLLTLACVALPLTVIGGMLQYTHNISPGDNGALYTGQSTYGDLHLHLAIASSLRDAAFPPDYSIFPGALLSYPFLTDSLSTSFMLMGFSLRAAIVVPGIWMMGLVFSGYVILAQRMADGRKAAVLAALFFFLNGGLGFLYMLDMRGEVLGSSGSNSLQSAEGLWQRIQVVLNGWYQTPANHAEFDTYNLRWSNVIVDMMVPQRTTLGGWTQAIPCLYLLYDALRPEEKPLPKQAEEGPASAPQPRRFSWRQALLLGVGAGMLPMINTHCFLALGLASFGWMIWDLIRNKRQLRSRLCFWGIYGGAAVLLAAPQLFTWTFRQAVGNESFLQFHFNWVNNSAKGGGLHLKDYYLWFYVKNIGLPFILLLISLLEKNEKRRFIASGAFVIFLAAELIQFQPNEYDNNKLFYIWYMLCAVLAADYAVTLLGRLTHRPARYALAVIGAVVCFSSGGLAVAREIRSAGTMRLYYAPAYSAEDVAAAEFVEENTPQHAVFLTANDLCDFVSSLAGRTIVCGPDTWLRFHGFDTDTRKQEISAFYADPAGHENTLKKYGVDYILVRYAECQMAVGYRWDSMDWNERQAYLQALNERVARLYPLVYASESGGVSIYAAEGGQE